MDLARRIATIGITVCLVVCLAGSGLLLLLFVPSLSGIVTGFTGNDADSPFDKTQLVATSVATQKYACADNDRSEVMAQVQQINREVASPYADYSLEELEQAPEQYTLTADALSHLDDCYAVFGAVKIVLLIVFLVMMGLIFFVGVKGSNFHVGGAFKTASLITIFAAVAVAVWAFTSWDTFFAFLHGMFFADGTWTFGADSLLICMYPEAFWTTMGVLWAAVSLVLSLIFYLVGRWMRRM